MAKFQEHGGGGNPAHPLCDLKGGRPIFFWGVFTYFGYARSKKALNFFETQNILSFGACQNFGRGQKQGFTL